jgi:hypothetical protein
MNCFNLFACAQPYQTPYAQGPFMYMTPQMYMYNLPQMGAMCPLNISQPAISETAIRFLNPKDNSDPDQGLTASEKNPRRVNNETNRKKNMRNIIPNIAHKILRYVSSEDCREILNKLYPTMSIADVGKFYEYTLRLRKSMRFYVGNKNLMLIWYRQTKSPKQA